MMRWLEHFASAVWCTEWPHSIASVKWGMRVLESHWSGDDKELRPRPAWESTQLKLEHNLDSGTVDPLCISGLAPLDTTWCTASGSPIKPEGLQCTIAIVCFPVLVCWSWTLTLWFHIGNTLFSMLVNKTINDGYLETMLHAELQPEDELTITDPAIVGHVLGISHARGCSDVHTNQQLKNSKIKM